MVAVFSEGYKKTDKQILKSKKSTLEEENYLIDEIPENCSLINITMRIPGSIKNNRFISRTFDILVNNFVATHKIVKQVIWDLSTGPQAFIVVQKDPGILKEEMIKFESEDPLGPIADINVFSVEDDEVSPITRKELGLQPRKCIVCDKTGHECKANHNHTEEEIHQAISKIINDNIKF